MRLKTPGGRENRGDGDACHDDPSHGPIERLATADDKVPLVRRGHGAGLYLGNVADSGGDKTPHGCNTVKGPK